MNIIPKTHQEEIKLLQKLGFRTNPISFKSSSLSRIWAESQKLLSQKNSLDIPLDGLVVKLDSNQIVQKLGVVGKTYRTWAALKSQQKEVTTQLLGVDWQVGRTGKLTPVADLQAVNLDGSIIKRATLHNFKEFQEKSMVFGEWLVIRKAGDIIPEVVKTLPNLRTEKQSEPIPVPEECLSCQTKLIYSPTKIDLICPNQANCREQIILRISYFASRDRANIEGLSRKLIEKFVDLYGVREFIDLYDLPWSEIVKLEGFGMKSVNNLRKAIEKTKVLPANKFLSGLGIEGVGLEVADLIIKNSKL